MVSKILKKLIIIRIFAMYALEEIISMKVLVNAKAPWLITLFITVKEYKKCHVTTEQSLVQQKVRVSGARK